MTQRNITPEGRQAIYAQETKEAFIVLLTISHESWPDDVRVSSDPTQLLPEAAVRGTISNGDEYVFAPFAVNLPAQDDSGVARANITVENVSRMLMQKIRQATSAVSITIQVVTSSHPDNIQVTVTDFKLERVTYDAFTITGEISVEYFDLEPFPAQRFVPSKYPAVF